MKLTKLSLRSKLSKILCWAMSAAELLSITSKFFLTSLTSALLLVGCVDDDGSWAYVPYDRPVANDSCSGTLPVLYVVTDSLRPVISREESVWASMYVDDGDGEGRSNGWLRLKIRGRGNYTWTHYEKQPYHLKLEKACGLLGMNESRTFLLLAHADDEVGFLRNAVGFEISRCMGFKFTPMQRPVELVINGDYRGLYFLTENIGVERHRLNIGVQSNGETDANRVRGGGWLVEIDNYSSDHQIRYAPYVYGLRSFNITYHEPEVLSDVQYDYLYNEFLRFLKSIRSVDKTVTDWADVVDVDWLARYYIVMEVIDHVEAFLGSTYLYKDIGDERWIFGPLWDLGNAFNGWHSKQQFIYQSSGFPASFMNYVVLFPLFQQKVREHWPEFYPDVYFHINDYIDDYAREIAAAVRSNFLRWPLYGNEDEYERAQTVKSRLQEKVEFLNVAFGN